MDNYNLEQEVSPKKIMLDLFQEVSEERADLKIQYNDNENRIYEIEQYILSVQDSSDSEFQVFSPRRSASLQKDKLLKLEEEKETLEQENSLIIKKIQVLNKKIDELNEALEYSEKEHEKFDESLEEENGPLYDEVLQENILEIIEIEECEKKNILREIRENSIQNLYHAVNKLNTSNKFIAADPVRAKLEIDMIKTSLDEVISSLEFSLSDLQPVSVQEGSFGEKFERLVLYFVQLFPNVHINYDVMKDLNINEFKCFILLKYIKNAIRFFVDYYGCENVFVLCETKEYDGDDYNIQETDIEDEEEFYGEDHYEEDLSSDEWIGEKSEHKYESSLEEYEFDEEKVDDNQDYGYDTEEDEYRYEDGYLDVVIADHEIDISRSESYVIVDDEKIDFDFSIMQRRVDLMEGFFEILCVDENNYMMHMTMPL